MSFTKQAGSVRQADTYQGDTLQKIALREMGDANQWRDLATLNNLVSPYLTDNEAAAGPRVLLAGQDTILLPTGTAAQVGVSDSVDVFGIDVALVNGRLAVGTGGDLLTVSGVENLKGALERRLDTRPGDLVFHKEYGSLAPTLIGKGGSQSAVQLAAAYVARALRSDPRIATADNVQATLTGDTVAVLAEPVAINGKVVPVGN